MTNKEKEICECGHPASMHSNGEYTHCGECYDDEGNCNCNELRIMRLKK